MTRAVLVTRSAHQTAGLVSALCGVGLEPVLVPTIAIELEPAGGDLDGMVRHLGFYTWVVITSTNGARAILKAAERVFTPFEASRFAVIGAATRRALEREGVDVDFEPQRSSAAALAAELPVHRGDRVLVVRGNQSHGYLVTTLRRRGAEVEDVIAYRTREAPETSRHLLRVAVVGAPIVAVLFTSGSTVRGLVSLGRAESIDVRSMPAVCIGPATAAEAQKAGFSVLGVSPTPDAAALAAATAKALTSRPLEAA